MTCDLDASPCYVMHGVPCIVILRHVKASYFRSYYNLLCCVMLCYVMLCYVMLYYGMLCYAMLRYVTLRCVALANAMLYYILLYFFVYRYNKFID